MKQQLITMAYNFSFRECRHFSYITFTTPLLLVILLDSIPDKNTNTFATIFNLLSFPPRISNSHKLFTSNDHIVPHLNLSFNPLLFCKLL
jgi:hypothetical protein